MLIKKIIKNILLPLLPLKIIYDLPRKFSILKNKKDVNNIINSLLKLDSVDKIFQYGAKKLSSMSDLDLLVILEENANYKDLKILCKKLYAHSFVQHYFIFVNKSLVKQILNNSILLNDISVNLKEYKKNGVKSRFYKPAKKENMQFIFSTIEWIVGHKLSMHKNINIEKRVSLTKILKDIKNSVYGLQAFNYTQPNNKNIFKFNNYINNIIKDYQKIFKEINKKFCLNHISKQNIVKLYNLTAKYRDDCLDAILNLREFRQINNIFPRVKIIIKNSSFGKIVFLKNLNKYEANFLIKFLKFCGLIFFDIRIYFYFNYLNHLISQKQKIDGIETKNNYLFRQLLLRKNLSRQWWNFLKTNKLLEYAGLSQAIIINNSFIKKRSIIDRIMEKIVIYYFV